MAAPIIYLIGWPGVGKLTVARELAAHTGWRVVDNHLVNDPIFHVVGADGIKPLPEGTRELVRQVRAAVYQAMTHLAPPDLGFILTNVLFDEEPHRQVFAQVESIAEHRGALLLPVLLTCDEQELRQRIVSPGRAGRLKPRTTDVLDQYSTRVQLPIDHPALLTLDTTHLAPERAVKAILTHLLAIQEQKDS